MMFELRAFFANFQQVKAAVCNLGSKNKGDYAFDDYIYHPLNRTFNFNQEFMRLRVYHLTQWQQKKVELVHKVKNTPGCSGCTVIKEQFDQKNEANPFLLAYQLAFSYGRCGTEFQLERCRIFVEDIDGLPPSVEILAPSQKEIDELFKQLKPTHIVMDSIPQLVQNIKGKK